MKFNPRFVKYSAFALALVFLTASLLGCAPSTVEEAPATEAPATQAPATETPAATATPEPERETVAAFTSTDLDGNAVDNTVFDNAELTFVNIWGTFCGPCINEMPDLGELANEYADKGVQFIGVLADASAETPDEIELAKQIREETGADYLHILNSQTVNAAMMNGVNAIPTSFFVNSKGEIVSEVFVGSQTKADWAATIDAVLEAQG